MTSWGLNRLTIYEGLGVPDVWLWRDGAFLLYRLTPGGYERRDRSEFLPELDFSALASLVDTADQTRAVRAFRDSLRRSS